VNIENRLVFILWMYVGVFIGGALALVPAAALLGVHWGLTGTTSVSGAWAALVSGLPISGVAVGLWVVVGRARRETHINPSRRAAVLWCTLGFAAAQLAGRLAAEAWRLDVGVAFAINEPDVGDLIEAVVALGLYGVAALGASFLRPQAVAAA
jgi:hypothetical protein